MVFNCMPFHLLCRMVKVWASTFNIAAIKMGHQKWFVHMNGCIHIDIIFSFFYFQIKQFFHWLLGHFGRFSNCTFRQIIIAIKCTRESKRRRCITCMWSCVCARMCAKIMAPIVVRLVWMSLLWSHFNGKCMCTEVGQFFFHIHL